MYFVYILQSNKNNKYYVGSTNDVERRLTEHNKGSGGKFTKLNGPWKLICFKIFDNADKAREIEKKIIHGEVPEWLKGAPC